MAVTEAGALLTETHRRQQLLIAASAIVDLRRVWPLFDLDDIDAAWERLGPLVTSLVLERANRSSALAAAYYGRFRSLEGVTEPFDPIRAEPATAQEVADSLFVTGPLRAKQLIAKGGGNVADRTFADTAGNVQRLVLNGGRDTVHANIDADPVPAGFSRVTDGNPCAFCAMLASRGPVFGSQAVAGRKYHNRCGCTGEPVWSTDGYRWPGRGQEFAALWRESTKGLSGNNARIAFRRAIEGR